VIDSELAPVVQESTEAHFIPCYTLCARSQKSNAKANIWEAPMKTRTFLLILVMFSTCGVADATGFGQGPYLLGNYQACRLDFPVVFGDFDKVISDPAVTEIRLERLKGLGKKLPTLFYLKQCLYMIDMMQAHSNLGGGDRLKTAVEHARIYLDSLLTQASPAAAPQNEIPTKPGSRSDR
jgi:hypothetical protein